LLTPYAQLGPRAGFEKHLRRLNVTCRVDGEVDPPTLADARLSRQVEHMRRVAEQVVQVGILQPALDEGEPVMPPWRREVRVLQRSRVVVSEAVEADHVGAVGEELLDQMGADKTGRAGHERPHASTFRIWAGSRDCRQHEPCGFKRAVRATEGAQ